MKRNLLIVDIQPCYHEWIGDSLVSDIRQKCDHFRNVHVMFNSEELTSDTISTVSRYLYDYKREFYYHEKEYAFFRGYMDNSISDEEIIKVGKRMLKEGVNDSRDLVNQNLLPLTADNIYFPDIDINQFKNKKWYLCGGSTTECLKEIEILFRVHSIRYQIIDYLTY